MFSFQEIEKFKLCEKKYREEIIRIDLKDRKNITKIYSEEFDGIDFFVAITRSEKMAIKLSMHLQNKTNIFPITRIDFNGGHQNPRESNLHLPDKFTPYIGKRFSNESHIHYQGYLMNIS